MSEEIKEVVAEIFIEVFEWDTLPPVESIDQSTISNWDSMKQLSLVTAIESEFEIAFSLDTAIAITSFNKAVEAVVAHLA
ncbi:acyl carrier protein [Saccharophagus degradans]|uniref:Carrier domain-containing protein n=1 Tax=Saccharophagus degradans (strain 2-40 / ATCC 43961 / DSM 17024) TaxID=203122 RepID=Q21PE4_SACD2|nr:acyl carrier protein [Saccharophagus degradans]ABD79435.1 hypothetical protein Sde_0171 [Saccharophagus degradans 2-40]